MAPPAPRTDRPGPGDEEADDGPLVRSPTALLLYAERPRRRAVQLGSDLAVVLWTVLGVSAAVALRDLVLTLQAPGRGLSQAGDSVRGAFTDASGAADGIPFVGDRLAGALGTGTRAGQSLVDAGNQQVETVASAASGLAWLVVLVLVVPVVLVWAVVRARWVLRARQAVLARTDDVDHLALRALTSASPRLLRRAAPDAAGAWRRGDPYVLSRLADVELARLGLRGPGSVRVGAPAPARRRLL